MCFAAATSGGIANLNAGGGAGCFSLVVSAVFYKTGDFFVFVVHFGLPFSVFGLLRNVIMNRAHANISGKDMSMALFAIGDTHLSLSTGKTMNVFNGWTDYEKRLENNWRRLVREDDTVVIAGDVSWCMDMEQGTADFEFLDSLPGHKLLMKGNHDYWWSTKKKADEYFERHGFSTLDILFNNAYAVGNIAVCGTRGWFFDAESDADKKIVLREAGRLRLSIEQAKATGLEPVVFLHYPPLNQSHKCNEIYDVLLEEGIKRCFYAHLHSYSHSTAFIGESDGIVFSLISSDFLGFCPKHIHENMSF